MSSRTLIFFLAFVVFFVFASNVALAENEVVSGDVNSAEDLKKMPVLGRSHKRRLLNLPGMMRPFCDKAVDTVQSAPQICESVTKFIVDSTYGVCKEGIREMCRIGFNSGDACEYVIQKICPSYDVIKSKIEKSVNKNCDSSLQKVIDSFGKVTSVVDKEDVCDTFVEGVRETCRNSIIEYCSDIEKSFLRYPCNTLLPGMVCG